VRRGGDEKFSMPAQQFSLQSIGPTDYAIHAMCLGDLECDHFFACTMYSGARRRRPRKAAASAIFARNPESMQRFNLTITKTRAKLPRFQRRRPDAAKRHKATVYKSDSKASQNRHIARLSTR
jgi:hypothetical protein